MTEENNAFAELGIDERFLPVLSRLGFTQPTPIQKQAIPIAIEGKDVLGIAQTGTGKTLAFGIPLIERLGKHGRGLILAPTRELAEQIVKEFDKVKNTFHIEAVAIVGGAAMYRQVKALLRKPRIIVATPGRLADHMRQGNVSLKDIQMIVLDEADRMLDLGFEPQVNEILKDVPRERQTLLFSATLDERVSRLANNYMNQPVRVEIARSGSIADNLTQRLYIVAQNMKQEMLLDMLKENGKGSTLVFVRTRIGAAKLKEFLKEQRFSATEIHSDRSQGQRKRALEGFKQGRYKIMVATDVAARGLDIDNIDMVINYDIPEEEDSYVHRIGRTARAGEKGLAVTFATPMQGFRVKAIEKYIEQEIPITAHETIRVDMSFSEKSLRPAKKGRSRSRQKGGGGRGDRKSFGKKPAGRDRGPREDRGSRGGDRDRSKNDSGFGRSFGGDRDRKKAYVARRDREREPRGGDNKKSYSDSKRSHNDRERSPAFDRPARAPREGRSGSSDPGRTFGVKRKTSGRNHGSSRPQKGRGDFSGKRKPFDRDAVYKSKKKSFSSSPDSQGSPKAKPATRGYQGDAPYKKRAKSSSDNAGGFQSGANRGGKPSGSKFGKKRSEGGFYAKKKARSKGRGAGRR